MADTKPMRKPLRATNEAMSFVLFPTAVVKASIWSAAFHSFHSTERPERHCTISQKRLNGPNVGVRMSMQSAKTDDKIKIWLI